MSGQGTPLRLFWAEFRENRIAVVALLVVVVMILVAFFAPLVSAAEPL